MPTTMRSRTQNSSVLEEGRELGEVELGIALGLPGDDRSELVERAEIGAGQPQRGAPARDPSALPTGAGHGRGFRFGVLDQVVVSLR